MYRGPKWFTYITQELPHLVPRMFPQISTQWEDTYVAGLSWADMALKCTLRAACVLLRRGAVGSGYRAALWGYRHGEQP